MAAKKQSRKPMKQQVKKQPRPLVIGNKKIGEMFQKMSEHLDGKVVPAVNFLLDGARKLDGRLGEVDTQLVILVRLFIRYTNRTIQVFQALMQSETPQVKVELPNPITPDDISNEFENWAEFRKIKNHMRFLAEWYMGTSVEEIAKMAEEQDHVAQSSTPRDGQQEPTQQAQSPESTPVPQVQDPHDLAGQP